MSLDRQPAEALERGLWANNGSDRERFTSLLHIAYSSKKGADTLDELSGLGYKFIYDCLWGAHAACNHIRKTIVMDMYHRSNMMSPSLIHEATHAIQFSRIDKDVAKLNTADYISLHRALEADACAHQAAFSYEIKDTYPEVYQEEMKSPIMQAYVKELENSGDTRRAMAASFKAWYDFDRYQTAYEEEHKKDIFHICSLAKKEPNGGYFSDTFSAGDILKVCTFEGKPYVDASFLNSDAVRAVSKETKKEIQTAMLEACRSTGVIADKTVSSLPVRGEEKDNNPVRVSKVLAQIRDGSR